MSHSTRMLRLEIARCWTLGAHTIQNVFTEKNNSKNPLLQGMDRQALDGGVFRSSGSSNESYKPTRGGQTEQGPRP